MRVIKKPVDLGDMTFNCSCSAMFTLSSKEYKQEKQHRTEIITRNFWGKYQGEEIPVWKISCKCPFCGQGLYKDIETGEAGRHVTGIDD